MKGDRISIISHKNLTISFFSITKHSLPFRPGTPSFPGPGALYSVVACPLSGPRGPSGCTPVTACRPSANGVREGLGKR